MASPDSVLSPEETPVCIKPNKRQKSKKTHVCRTCHKSFSRQEHCTRHERSHTRERPYPCRYCPNRYARKDLVLRHEKSLHVDVYAPQETASKYSLHNRSKKASPEETTRSSLEDLLEPRVDPSNLPPSPKSSDPHDSAFDSFSDYRSGINTTFDLPLTPIELPEIPVDVVYRQSEKPQSPNDDLLGGSGVQDNNMFESDSQENDILPPHVLDPTFYDLDFFQNIQHATDYDLSSSTTTDGLCSIDELSPSLNLPSPHEVGNDEYSSAYTWERSHNSTHQEPSGQPSIIYQTNKIFPPGRTIKTKGTCFILNDTTRQWLLIDLGKRLGPDLCNSLKLPTASLLERFLSSYQSCFHQHYPILHLATMDLSRTPSPLILAICAIGALYRLEPKHAVNLQQWADRATRSGTCEFSPSPVWVVQCKLLLAFSRIFSGTTPMVQTTLESLDYFSTEFNCRRVDLERSRTAVQAPSWASWVERETSKRLLCGIFVLNSLVAITYNTTPRVNILPDTEIEIPHEEVLWDATTSSQWVDLMACRTQYANTTIIDAVNHVIHKKPLESADAALWWSTFATTLVMHAVNVHIYNLIQCTQSFALFTFDSASQNMRAAAAHQAETALERCRDLFSNRHSEHEQRLDDHGGSRRSNGLSLLRVAYVRSCTEVEALNRMMLLSTNPINATDDIRAYISSGQKRSTSVTNTARMALDGLSTAVKAGIILARKTAALIWSIDHAIADWNCALFVTRWIHTLECQQQTQPLDIEERQVLEDLVDLLSDADITYDGSTSLAAEVIKLWAGFFDDTWVWGITPRIGAVLRIMGTICESDRTARKGSAYNREFYLDVGHEVGRM